MLLVALVGGLLSVAVVHTLVKDIAVEMTTREKYTRSCGENNEVCAALQERQTAILAVGRMLFMAFGALLLVSPVVMYGGDFQDPPTAVKE